MNQLNSPEAAANKQKGQTWASAPYVARYYLRISPCSKRCAGSVVWQWPPIPIPRPFCH